MDSKRQKRPDMQIYRPPRSKDRQFEEEPGKCASGNPRRAESNKKEEIRTFPTQQNQQQIRSRVFRRRAARDEDPSDEDTGTTRAAQKSQQWSEDSRRNQGRAQSVEDEASYREEDKRASTQQRYQKKKGVGANHEDFTADNDERGKKRGKGKAIDKSQARNYMLKQPLKEKPEGFQKHMNHANGPQNSDSHKAWYEQVDDDFMDDYDFYFPSEPVRPERREYNRDDDKRREIENWGRNDYRYSRGGGRGGRRGRGGGLGQDRAGDNRSSGNRSDFVKEGSGKDDRRKDVDGYEGWKQTTGGGRGRGGGRGERGGIIEDGDGRGRDVVRADGHGRSERKGEGTERGMVFENSAVSQGGRMDGHSEGGGGGSRGMDKRERHEDKGNEERNKIRESEKPYGEGKGRLLDAERKEGNNFELNERGEGSPRGYDSGKRGEGKKGKGGWDGSGGRQEGDRGKVKKNDDNRGSAGDQGRGGKNTRRLYDDYHDDSPQRSSKGRGSRHLFEENFSPTSRRPDGGKEASDNRRTHAAGKQATDNRAGKSREEKHGSGKEESVSGRDFRPQRGVSRRTISCSSSRSATLEEEFREDQRLFNPYSSSSSVQNPPSPSSTSVAPAHQRARPHASGILRLPANLNIASAPPIDRPVMVVRPNPIGMPGNGPRVPGPGILHIPPAVMATSEAEMWAPRRHPRDAFFPIQTSQMDMVWKNVCDLDHELSALLGRYMGQVTASRDPLAEMEWWRQVKRLRHSLMDSHATLLMSDLELCNQRQLEQALWKTAFYAVIDPLKKFLDLERRPDLAEVALEVIAEGDRFFRSCVEKLEGRYGVQIEAVWTNGYLPPETANSRSSCLAFLSAQKLLLFLGDLSRYRELVNQTNDYGMARTWYLRAQQLAPKNGRPYHQLAVLAMYTKRQMDAMYFYMRSLACGNPFTSASQALLALFDEVRRKAREASRVVDNGSRSDPERGASAVSGSRQAVRLEIWIHPADGRRTKNRIDDGVEDKADEDLQLLSFVELNKRFCLSFMHCHGMLFTRIGMESFPERCAQLLKEFCALLQRSPCAFSETQLLQLTFINIFNVARASSTTIHDASHACMRSVLFEQATRFGMDMFALMAERACQLLETVDMKEDVHLDSLPRDLRPLLSALCLWTDWMVVHPQDWRPPPSLLDPHLNSPAPDEWQILAQLSTLLDRLLNCSSDVPNVCSSSEAGKANREKKGSVVLNEERMSAGFKPMVNMEPQLYLYERQGVEGEEETVCDYLRMDKLSMFAEFLCGMQTPYFEFDVNERKYKSLVPSLASEKTSDHEYSTQESRETEESCASDVASSPVAEGGREVSGELEDLRQRKLDLEKQLKEQEDREALVRSALAEGSQRMIELEIVPVFVLPDTNCYIDHLHDIRVLVRSKTFTIVLPIIVLNELDGLCRADDGSEQTRQIAVRAKESVQFLEEEFEQRNSRLKAVTSKGTQLETIAFRSETIHQEGNNDDVILACCLHYCVDKARDFMPRSKDEPYHLHREVVLLTSDRNLRLKALGSNIPARPLPRFMAWAYP